MNRNVIILSILVLAIVGTIVVTQKNQKAAELRQMQLKAAEKANKLAAEAQKAINEAKMAEEAAKQAAEALKAKMNGLVVQAKSLLEDNKYQEAINIAKNILSQDANNADAKSILETAMAKLKEIAQQQAEALTKQEAQKTLENLGAGLTVPGQ